MATLLSKTYQVTQADMESICPECAVNMRTRGIKSMRIPIPEGKYSMGDFFADWEYAGNPKFSKEERECISSEIRSAMKKGKPQKQSIAIGISKCAPGKAIKRSAGTAEKVCSRIWSAGPDHQRAFFGSGPEGVGRDGQPPVAWFCDCVERVKGRMAERKKTSGYSDDLPGGKFDAKQNSDGTWNIYGVDIFAEHTIRYGKKRVRIGKQFMVKAMRRAERRYRQDNYLPPLHVNHHGTEKGTERAGFFKLRSVKKSLYEGKPLWVLFADLIRVPDEIYQAMRRGELPYRSVEIHDFSMSEIDSLALLNDEVPFFRLQLLTIGEEQPYKVETAHRFDDKTTPVLAYQSLGGRAVQVLSRFQEEGVNRMAMRDEALAILRKDPKFSKKYMLSEEEKEMVLEELDEALDAVSGEEEMPEEMMMDEREKELMPVEEEEAKMMDEDAAEDAGVMAEVADTLHDWVDVLNGLIDKLRGGPGEEMQMPPEEGEAPSPVEMMSAKTAKAATNGTNGEVRSDYSLAKLAAEVTAMKREKKIEQAIAAYRADLSKYGLDADEEEKRLREIVETDGIGGMKVYVDAIKRHCNPDPPKRFADDKEPKTASPYARYGESVERKAQQYGSEYDDFKSRGMRFAFDRKTHIANCLAAEGIQIKKEK